MGSYYKDLLASSVALVLPSVLWLESEAGMEVEPGNSSSVTFTHTRRPRASHAKASGWHQLEEVYPSPFITRSGWQLERLETGSGGGLESLGRGDSAGSE